MATSYREIQSGPSNGFNRWDIPVKFGLLIGLISIILTTINNMFIMPWNYGAYWGFTIISFLIGIFLVYYVGVRQRTALGGYINLKEAFSAIFIAILISSLVSTIWNVVYARVIDPELPEKIKVGALAAMEKMKAPPEKIDEKAKEFDEMFESGFKLKGILLGFAQLIVITSIFGFICAAIVRREPMQEMR